jgi:hypothetical protein
MYIKEYNFSFYTLITKWVLQIERNFDLLDIETSSIPFNSYGLVLKRT